MNMVTGAEVYRRLSENYPCMSSELQNLLQHHDLSIEQGGFGRDLHVFGGRFTGDGKLYDQADYLLIVDRKRVGRLREISQRGRLIFSQVVIDEGVHPLSLQGQGFYVQYDFEAQRRQDNNPVFAFP
jgi:hypothetical protein